jgi:hypothetical protein
MRLLYPSDPLNKAVVDEAFAEEFDAVRSVGFDCSLFSFEDFESSGSFRPRPRPGADEEILYRGWMLTPDSYVRLHAAIAGCGGKPKTGPEQYRRCHYLPEWYSQCRELTPETVFLPRDADFASALAGRDWPAFFVKDYVKSLTTQRGSVAHTPAEVSEVVSLIEQYRGSVEGGVCVRRFEDLLPETEERYFVLDGRPFGRTDAVPDLVSTIAGRIDSPFFSVDVVLSANGEHRLIELGDGQVSDRKKWSAERFAAMLRGARQAD